MDRDRVAPEDDLAGSARREPTRHPAGQASQSDPEAARRPTRRARSSTGPAHRAAPAADGRAALGRLGERLAAAHLERSGYQIRARNVRSPYGEIDLIAGRDEWLIFVEVRARQGDSFGDPVETLGPRKQARLRATALDYCNRLWEAGAPAELSWRIDLIAVRFDDRGRLIELEHLENVVTD